MRNVSLCITEHSCSVINEFLRVVWVKSSRVSLKHFFFNHRCNLCHQHTMCFLEVFFTSLVDFPMRCHFTLSTFNGLLLKRSQFSNLLRKLLLNNWLVNIICLNHALIQIINFCLQFFFLFKCRECSTKTQTTGNSVKKCWLLMLKRATTT